MDYKIEIATEKNFEVILSLYHSFIGKDGCSWDFDYPSNVDVKNDISNNSLYIVIYNEEIIAAAAACNEEELGAVGCFSKDIKKPYALSRVAVKAKYQNKGIAKFLINYLEKEVVKKGGDGLRLLVSKTNPHAIAVYDKMNYICCGECLLYDNDWYCYEKDLTI